MVLSRDLYDSPHAITPRVTLHEVIERWPEAWPVMGRYGMRRDCCGGLTLAAIAERNNLDVDTMLEELRRAAAGAA